MSFETAANVAVILPTRDRPTLLEEAIASALSQTHAPLEVVVIDDGSAPAVDAAGLRERHGTNVRVVRNETSRGKAFSRNRGVEETRAEYVIHLDDDDLLAPDAIKHCLAALRRFPNVEWVAFAVVGFGPRAEHFNRVQPAGVERVVELGSGVRTDPDTVLFDRHLFPAMLQTVPVAFQRAFVHRETWARVSQLRWLAYRDAGAPPDIESAKLKIAGPLRDSEWARYAAIACRSFAYVTHPLYQQRCAGHGYSSLPENRQLHADQSLAMLETLYRASHSVQPIREWAPEIRKAMAQANFDFAYTRAAAGQQPEAWTILQWSAATHANWRQLRLAARIVLNFLYPSKLPRNAAMQRSGDLTLIVIRRKGFHRPVNEAMAECAHGSLAFVLGTLFDPPVAATDDVARWTGRDGRYVWLKWTPTISQLEANSDFPGVLVALHLAPQAPGGFCIGYCGDPLTGHVRFETPSGATNAQIEESVDHFHGALGRIFVPSELEELLIIPEWRSAINQCRQDIKQTMLAAGADAPHYRRWITANLWCRQSRLRYFCHASSTISAQCFRPSKILRSSNMPYPFLQKPCVVKPRISGYWIDITPSWQNSRTNRQRVNRTLVRGPH